MIDLLQYPAALITLCGLLGLCVGSFLNVVVYRYPRMLQRDWLDESVESVAAEAPETLRGQLQAWWQQAPLRKERSNLLTPRSRCPACGHAITAMENVPVLSYVLLRGRCKACKARISPRYPLVEVLSAALSAAIAWKFGYSLACLGGLVFVWTCVALTFIDLDTFLLPDSMTLPLLWLGLLLNLNGTFVSLADAVIGAIAGYLALWSVYWLFKLVTGKEGMGYGDFKLLAAIGAWLGWQVLPVVILLSSVVGAIVGIALILFAKHGRETPIPFGPYLAAAGVLGMFFGEKLSQMFMPIAA